MLFGQTEYVGEPVDDDRFAVSLLPPTLEGCWTHRICLGDPLKSSPRCVDKLEQKRGRQRMSFIAFLFPLCLCSYSVGRGDVDFKPNVMRHMRQEGTRRMIFFDYTT